MTQGPSNVAAMRTRDLVFAAYQNPASVFADATKDVPVLKIAGSALKAAKEAIS